MTVNFNRLRVFHSVIETGGISKAAKQLHVTQSAVSQHVQKLEEEVKTPLFVRLQNRLVPTDAGKRLDTIVAPFVKQLEAEMALFLKARETPMGCLRVGAPVEFGVHYLPAIFTAFRARHPEVSFYLELGHPEVLLPKLQDGRLDMAFADLFSKDAEHRREYALLSIETVMNEALILISSLEYHDVHFGERGTYASLEAAEYVAYQENGAALKSWFRYHFKKLPRPLEIALTVESVQCVVASVKAGLGLGVVPSHIVEHELERGELIQIVNRKRPLTNTISLVRLLDKHPTLAEKCFVRHLREEMAMPG